MATSLFDPEKHLIKLPRKVKDEHGNWTTRYDDYLEVKWRLVWFRDKYPHGQLTTEEICVDLTTGYARFRATAEDGEGGKATGTGTELRKQFEDFVEKAETRAIGRALAALGIGTQFVGQDLSEGQHVVDAPRRPHARDPHRHEDAMADGHESTTQEVRPLIEFATVAQVNGLFDLALGCVTAEAFGQDMRARLKMPDQVKITRGLLRSSMPKSVYTAAWNDYQAMRQHQQDNVSRDGNDPLVSTPSAEPQTAMVDEHPTDMGEAIYATAAELDALMAVAAGVGKDASAEVERLRAHHPKGVTREVLAIIETRLKGRAGTDRQPSAGANGQGLRGEGHAQ